jgi:hypothetical protein
MNRPLFSSLAKLPGFQNMAEPSSAMEVKALPMAMPFAPTGMRKNAAEEVPTLVTLSPGCGRIRPNKTKRIVLVYIFIASSFIL